jgi:hypothetical protein
MAKHLLFAVILGLAIVAGPAGPLSGQEMRASSGDRLEGKVQKVDRQKSLILVIYKNVTRQVLYDESTRFTVQNQPGSLDAVKDGRPVICRGKFDWRNRLVAYRVDVREMEK